MLSNKQRNVSYVGIVYAEATESQFTINPNLEEKTGNNTEYGLKAKQGNWCYDNTVIKVAI